MPASRKLHNVAVFVRMLAALPVVFFSCTKADVNFGNSLLGNGHTQIIKTDTFSVNVQTVYLDSVITNNKATGLAGVYKDPWFGLIKAKCYLEIAPPMFSDTFENSSFDSIDVMIYLNREFYGDTTKPITINIHRLLENLKFEKGNSNFYNTSLFAYDSQPLASKTFYVTPASTDSINIRLPDELGREWLNMLATGSDTIKSSTAFRQYFKGLCIAAPGDDGIIFGFKDSVQVRVHFRQSSLYPVEKYVVFDLNNRQYQFNNIIADRSATAIASLSSTNKKIDASQTSDAGYSQYISAIVAKISFPGINDLLLASGYAGISSAQLRIRPEKSSFGGPFSLPAAMRLTTTDGTNEFGTDLYYLDNSAQKITQDGSLQIDGLYGINTYYSYDVTSYVSSLLTQGDNSKYGLLLSPPADRTATAFDRLVIGNSNNENSKTELIIYYIVVQ